MIDTTQPLGRAVVAAFRLAEKKSWGQVSLLDIADEAGLTLVELSRHVSSKTAVLRAFARLVDDEVLRKAERREPEESLRERLFDVVMTRFETMAPYRAGLKRIAAETSFAPELLPSVMTSQAWMLVAAGIPAEGAAGGVRVAGLASVYAATFRDWLNDDDAGMAKTMAALDRRLRRGEGWIKTFDSVASAGHGAFARLRDGIGQAMAARRSGASMSASDQGSSPETATPPPEAAKTPPADESGSAPGTAGPGEPTSRLH
jgi:ubiquinone biosynthesis protein COQ9